MSRHQTHHNVFSVEEISTEKDRLDKSTTLLPNRWIIAVGAGLFLGLKSTGFGFEMTPIKFYQLFMETLKYVCLSLVVVSVWMTMFRYFVGRLKGELTWFAILMIFLFSTEAFANIFLSFGKQVLIYTQSDITTGNEQYDERIMKAKSSKEKEEFTVLENKSKTESKRSEYYAK